MDANDRYSGDDSRLNNSKIVVLQHPSGSKVYIVATAHISKASQKDVVDIIESVSPTVVVLELDSDRMQRLLQASEFGDRFGLERYKNTGTFKIIAMALSGELLSYASGLFYVCSGALMGTQPGGEFLAAAQAAERLGARVVLADRTQEVTMKRLQWYTRKLIEVDRGNGMPVSTSQFPTSQSPPRIQSIGDDDSNSNSTIIPDSVSTNAPSSYALQAKLEVEAAMKDQENPWGLNDDDSSEQAIKARLLRMMREGGCPEPNQVLQAAQRLLRAGMDPKVSISPQDILQVRSCGATLIETFRQRALQGDDAWIKEFEIESVTGAKGALGAARRGAAMRKVILDERDLVLARRLWEAGEEAGGQAVVGVVGAGHVRGIQRYWDRAGSAEALQKAEDYSQLPPGEGPPSYLAVAAAAGVLGWISYRRPKAAGLFIGAVTLATAPYLGFTLFSMNRFTGFATKLVNACTQIDDMEQTRGQAFLPDANDGFLAGGSDNGNEWS